MAKLAATERVQAALRAAGLDTRVLILEESTRTAALAAAALSVPLGSIVKSLVFLADGKPVLVLVSGDRRVDEGKVARVLGAHEVRLATAAEVKELTGYPIGGVPPIGHEHAIPVLMDAQLNRFEVLYAAAGHPQAVFPIEPGKLVELTGGTICNITAGS